MVGVVSTVWCSYDVMMCISLPNLQENWKMVTTTEDVMHKHNCCFSAKKLAWISNTIQSDVRTIDGVKAVPQRPPIWNGAFALT